MRLVLREFGIIAVLGIALLWSTGTHAERYRDQSGLDFGRYVWQPTAKPDGPVVVIVSLIHKITHVYRGGVEIGIAPCRFLPRRNTPVGVFKTISTPIRQAIRSHSGRGAVAFKWTGERIYVEGDRGRGRWRARGTIMFPEEFAVFLSDAMPANSTIVITNERTLPQTVARSFLGNNHNSASSGSSPNDPKIAAVVVSRADQRAAVVRGGRIVWTGPVEISRPKDAIGTHVFTMIEGAGIGKTQKWLAIGLWSNRFARHIQTGKAEAALDRVLPGASAIQTGALGVGSSVVITDKPLKQVVSTTPVTQSNKKPKRTSDIAVTNIPHKQVATTTPVTQSNTKSQPNSDAPRQPPAKSALKKHRSERTKVKRRKRKRVAKAKTKPKPSVERTGPLFTPKMLMGAP